MIIHNWRKASFELCEVLGFDPAKIRSVKIEFGARAPFTVTVEHLITAPDAAKVAAVLKQYVIVEKTKDD